MSLPMSLPMSLRMFRSARSLPPRPHRSRLLASTAVTACLAVVLLGSGRAASSAAPATTATAATAATTTATTTTSTTTTTTTTTTMPPTTTTPAPGPACSTGASASTPVICLPSGSGEDAPSPIGTDETITFDAQVVNNGPAVTDAQVVITLPAGLRVDPGEDDEVLRYDGWWQDDGGGDGTLLSCTTTAAGADVACDTGQVEAGANFLVGIDLTAQVDAVPGTSAAFTVALQPVPASDPFPITSVRATVDFTGTAHLQVALTPMRATVTVGQSTTLVATIRNVGPDPAPGAAAIGILSKDAGKYPFVITNSEPLPGDPGPFVAVQSDRAGKAGRAGQSARAGKAGRAVQSARAARPMTSRPTNGSTARSVRAAAAETTSSSASAAPPPAGIGVDPGSFGFWPVDTIAPGATATVQVVVRAESTGTAELAFLVGSDATDPGCDGADASECENTALASLTAVAATSATTPPPTTPTTAAPTTGSASAPTVAPASAAALPNTGFTARPWVSAGLGAVALGLGLMLMARPRRRHRPSHS